MAGIEETLARISKMGGVEGFVITDSEGVILRQSKSFSDQLAHVYAAEVVKLARRARHVVRDLDPKTDLEFFRMRMRNNREILAAPGKDFLVVVVQHWRTASESGSAAAPS